MIHDLHARSIALFAERKRNTGNGLCIYRAMRSPARARSIARIHLNTFRRLQKWTIATSMSGERGGGLVATTCIHRSGSSSRGVTFPLHLQDCRNEVSRAERPRDRAMNSGYTRKSPPARSSPCRTILGRGEVRKGRGGGREGERGNRDGSFVTAKFNRGRKICNFMRARAAPAFIRTALVPRLSILPHRSCRRNPSCRRQVPLSREQSPPLSPPLFSNAITSSRK